MSTLPTDKMEGNNNDVKKEDQPSRSQRFKTSMHNAGHFLYNSDTGEVLGRTGISWLKVLSFYLVFYGVLAAFWAACMIAFIRTLDPVAPTMQKMFSMMKDNPGMNYEPFPDTSTTLIFFNKSDSTTYEAYIKRLNATYSEYENMTMSGRKKCSNGDGASPDVPCFFDIKELNGSCTPENDFGYSTGRPCVLLRINKVFLWQPNSVTLESTCSGQKTDACKMENEFLLLPEDTRTGIEPGFISVSCEGENEGDRDNIKSVSFYPSSGFPAYFYPYYNQPGYKSPPVMAQFDLVDRGRVSLILCQVWTKDIIHDKNDLQGSIHFELFIQQ